MVGRQSSMLAISSQTLFFALCQQHTFLIENLSPLYFLSILTTKLCIFSSSQDSALGCDKKRLRISFSFPLITQSLSTCFLCSINPTRSDFGNFNFIFFLKKKRDKEKRVFFYEKTAKSKLITGMPHILINVVCDRS